MLNTLLVTIVLSTIAVLVLLAIAMKLGELVMKKYGEIIGLLIFCLIIILGVLLLVGALFVVIDNLKNAGVLPPI